MYRDIHMIHIGQITKEQLEVRFKDLLRERLLTRKYTQSIQCYHESVNPYSHILGHYRA